MVYAPAALVFTAGIGVPATVTSAPAAAEPSAALTTPVIVKLAAGGRSKSMICGLPSMIVTLADLVTRPNLDAVIVYWPTGSASAEYLPLMSVVLVTGC